MKCRLGLGLGLGTCRDSDSVYCEAQNSIARSSSVVFHPRPQTNYSLQDKTPDVR